LELEGRKDCCNFLSVAVGVISSVLNGALESFGLTFKKL
jgi:hypothetical protein